MSENAPSTNNYTLGRGELSINEFDPSTGLYLGERSLGNAVDVSLSLEKEVLDHYSNLGGLKKKDLQITLQFNPMLTFTLDEVNWDNLAMLTMAVLEEISQIAADGLTEEKIARQGSYINLAKRAVGVTTQAFDGGTGAWAIGEAIVGAGGAEGVVVGIYNLTGTTVGLDQAGLLYVHRTNAIDFVDAEALTGDGTGTADAVGVQAELLTNVAVTDETTSAAYMINVDYTFDSASGRIRPIVGGGITDGDAINIYYACDVATYNRFKGLSKNKFVAFIRFRSDNPAGTNLEFQAWRCNVTPSGETALISDEWMTLPFSAELLADTEGHADSPYFDYYSISI